MKETMSEYAAVRDGGAGVIGLSTRGRIRVTGSEAILFLNGLVSNDMKTLAEHRWMPAVFPTVQGRLIGAVRIVRGKNTDAKNPAFLIDTAAESHDAVVKTISRFTLAGDFHVADVTAETALLSIQGKRAVEVIEKIFETQVSDQPRNGAVEIEWQNTRATIIRATHTGEDGFDVFVASTHVSQLREAFENAGAISVGDETFEILRIEAGEARHGRDMDETNVVLETNLDDAVSYSKGCYIGQEIIVRIKHRGHVAKKLAGLRLDSDRKIEAGTVIKSADSQEIGKVTSATFSPKLGTTIALGYVRYEHLEPGTNVLVDDGIKATVTELPFVRGSWYQNNG